jgi:hypothetical protein
MEFASVATPQTESEMAVMVSMLDAFEVPNFVHNLGFGGLYPGLQIRLYNVRRIMVPVDHVANALELLSVFEQHNVEPETDDKLRLADKLRVIVETILFGWSFPTRRKNLQKETDDDI